MRSSTLPGTNLFDLETPLIIYNDTLFQTTLGDNGVDFLDLAGIDYSVEPVMEIDELESLYMERNQEAIVAFQTRFMRTLSRQDYMSRDRINQLISNNRTLAFLADRVLPLITDENRDQRLLELLGEDIVYEQPEGAVEVPLSVLRELARVKRDLVSRIENEYRPVTNASGDYSALTQALGTNPFLIVDDRVYMLFTVPELGEEFQEEMTPSACAAFRRFPTTASKDEAASLLTTERFDIDRRLYSKLKNLVNTSSVFLDDRLYFPILVGSADDVERLHGNLLEKRIKIAAIENDEYQSLELHKIAEQRQRLEQLANRREYVVNDAGFKILNGGYYAFVRTPPYALKSPHVSSQDCYVPFGPAEVAVRISQSGSGFDVGNPIVINSYAHPFLSGSSSMQKICLGSWSTASNTHRLNSEEKVARLLDQGTKTLMTGYRSGNNPYNRLDKNHFSDWLTREQVDRRGLVVLNELME